MFNRLLLDNRFVSDVLFYPRSAMMETFPENDLTRNGILQTDAVSFGYRLFLCRDARAFVLMFHGNGEIAADYDMFAPFYRRAGLSVMVVDYRGYGWSTGEERGSHLLPDAEAILFKLSKTLHDYNLSRLPRFVMGRSLGGAPAIHLAYHFPEQFRGLIIESTFAHLPTMLTRFGLPRNLAKILHDPIGNARKMEHLRLPVLFVHGDEDDTIPVEHGQQLYDLCPSQKKMQLRVADAAHSVMVTAPEQYVEALRQFLNMALELTTDRIPRVQIDDED